MEKIIEYARQIAKYRGYPVLINGLQPVEDYDIDGEVQPGLRTKLDREMLELREAWQSWQSGQGKTEWHVAHEAADVFYYSLQLEEQTGRSAWPVMWQSVRLYLPYSWQQREVAAAALAKYGYRASAAKNKDEARELQLIQQAIEALPIVQMGRPVVFGPQVGFEIKKLSADLAAYIDETRGNKSRRMRLEEIVREHMNRFSSKLENISQNT